MIEFQLLDIGSMFHRKVIVSYYADSRACSNKKIKAAKLNILFTAAETSWKLKAHPTARAVSHLAW